jgi:hypothetical protein
MKTRSLLCLIAWLAFPAVISVWAASPTVTLPKLSPLPQITRVTLNPNSVTGGAAQVLGTVTLNQQAPVGGVPVIFQSSNPSVAAVPQGVVVQPGASSATFTIQTYPVAANPNVVNPNPPAVQIGARIGNSAPVVAQLAVYAATLASLALNPATVRSGSKSTGTVTLTGPAPSGGVAVTLTSGNLVSVPQQLTIRAGATTGSFAATTTKTSALSTAVPISAALGVFVTKTATLTLTSYIDLASFSTNPSTWPAGSSSTGTVTLTEAAPAGGITISLGLPVAGLGPCWPPLTGPATVKVEQGHTSATFPISSQPSASDRDGHIRASYSTTQYAPFTVLGPLIASFALSGSTVKGGSSIQGTIHLVAPAVSPDTCPNFNLYNIASSNTYYAQVPPQIAITPGTTQGTFTITTSAVTSTQSVTISAIYTSFGGKQATLTITP